MKRTNIYWPDELLERVRVHAEKTGTTSSDVMRTAVEAYLTAHEIGGQAKTAAQFSILVNNMRNGLGVAMKKINEHTIEVSIGGKPKKGGK